MNHSKKKITEALGLTEDQLYSCMEVAKVASMADKVSQQMAQVIDSFGMDKDNPNVIMFCMSAYMLGQAHFMMHISKLAVEVEKVNPY